MRGGMDTLKCCVSYDFTSQQVYCKETVATPINGISGGHLASLSI